MNKLKKGRFFTKKEIQHLKDTSIQLPLMVVEAEQDEVVEVIAIESFSLAGHNKIAKKITAVLHKKGEPPKRYVYKLIENND